MLNWWVIYFFLFILLGGGGGGDDKVKGNAVVMMMWWKKGEKSIYIHKPITSRECIISKENWNDIKVYLVFN